MRVRFVAHGLWVWLTVGACGATGGEEGAADASAQDGNPEAAAQAVRACELVDLSAAAGVIGADTEHPGGDTEEWTCIYSSPGVALLTIQLAPAASYDQVTIRRPHTALDVGERGRYNTEDNGPVAVQFLAGGYSVTMGVRPLGSSDADYLEPLVAVARDVARRLE